MEVLYIALVAVAGVIALFFILRIFAGCLLRIIVGTAILVAVGFLIYYLVGC